MLSSVTVGLEVMSTNDDGLAANVKQLEFKDRTGVTKPDVVGLVKMKLAKEMRSNQIFLKGYVIARKEKEEKGGGGLTSS